MPRHPPCALSNLTTQNESFFFHFLLLSFRSQQKRKLDEIGFSITLCSFQGARPSNTFATSASVPVADVNRCLTAWTQISLFQPLLRPMGSLPARLQLAAWQLASRRRRREILATFARLVNPSLEVFLQLFKLDGCQAGRREILAASASFCNPCHQEFSSTAGSCKRRTVGVRALPRSFASSDLCAAAKRNVNAGRSGRQ